MKRCQNLHGLKHSDYLKSYLKFCTELRSLSKVAFTPLSGSLSQFKVNRLKVNIFLKAMRGINHRISLSIWPTELILPLLALAVIFLMYSCIEHAWLHTRYIRIYMYICRAYWRSLKPVIALNNLIPKIEIIWIRASLKCAWPYEISFFWKLNSRFTLISDYRY